LCDLGIPLRIDVYRKNQTGPAHRISRELAIRICSERLGKPRGDGIELTTSESLTAIKRRLQPGYVTILPVRDWKEPILLTYPLRDQCSFNYRP